MTYEFLHPTHRFCGRPRKRISYQDQCRSLTQVRHDDPDGLGHLNVAAARGALQRVDRAYQAFFRRCKDGGKPGYPRFRSHRRYTTIEINDVRPSQVTHSGTHTIIRINGLPLIRLRRRRPLPDAKPRTIRIVRRGRGVTVDLVYEHQPEALAPNDDAVGIDLGIRKRLTLSTGEHVAPETTDWRKVRRAQRRISRCRRGSRRRRKRVAALARLRRREAVRSRNACHRATSRIVRQFGVIAIEQLAVSRMSRSARGTREAPGHNIRAKTGLNRSLLEQSWGRIRQQLAYKAEWAGRQLVEVDPRYSSQDCSTCGTRRENPDAREHWTCTACGTTHDRDVNAAVNLLIRAGILALGSRSSGRAAA